MYYDPVLIFTGVPQANVHEWDYQINIFKNIFNVSKENLDKNNCNLIKKELDNSKDFISFYHNLNKKESSLAQKISRITLNILLDDTEKQEYLFTGFCSNIINRKNTGSLDEIHQMIIHKVLKIYLIFLIIN